LILAKFPNHGYFYQLCTNFVLIQPNNLFIQGNQQNESNINSIDETNYKNLLP